MKAMARAMVLKSAGSSKLDVVKEFTEEDDDLVEGSNINYTDRVKTPLTAFSRAQTKGSLCPSNQMD